MSGYDLDDDQDREDRRKHLELVSAVITRMAGVSATAKGWSVTVAIAAFGVAVISSSWYLFLLGVLGLVVFGALDSLYLHNERKFRDLYDAIVRNSVEPLAMDTKELSVHRKNKTYVSWSVLAFYGPLILAGIALLIASVIGAPRDDHTANASAKPQLLAYSEPREILMIRK